MAAPPMSPRGLSKFGSADLDQCLVCSKRVYMIEKLVAEGKIFHKACFRCVQCQKVPWGARVDARVDIDG